MSLKALFFLLTITNIAFTNPFLIEVNKKEKFVVDDYLVIQSQLRSIDISSLISSYYQEFIHVGEADPT